MYNFQDHTAELLLGQRKLKHHRKTYFFTVYNSQWSMGQDVGCDDLVQNNSALDLNDIHTHTHTHTKHQISVK